MFKNTDVEANIAFGLGQARIKFEYEGKEYALRMTKQDFDALEREWPDKIKMTGVINEG